jgi:hypothetical protein
MKALVTMGLAALVFVTAAVVPPAQAQGIFQLSCEGIESGGGGTTSYQYTVKNVSGVPQTLQHFIVGTDVLDGTKYAAPYSPGNQFVFSLMPSAQAPCGFVPYTSGLKTPHGVVPPQASTTLQGFIVWSHPIGLLLAPNATATFGFTCALRSKDAEWGAFNPQCVGNVALSNVPVAGPMGVYTLGFVHSPAPTPVPGLTPWGVALIVLLLLGVGAWALLARRKGAPSAA